VAEQEKKYRPLFEALVSKTNGLDILAEITGEKKAPEEKKEAAAPAPTDTFSGMLQALPMLVMLPAIMPLLQQMLTQTLSSTTVNVKVESATAIVPIDISASTAIVPIEIKASTVTLNVNITGSDVTLNVSITGAVARVGIEIQAQSVDVQLTETYWTMRGRDKVISGWDFVTPVGGIYYDYVIEYTVPSGKKLVVYAIDITLEMIRYGSGEIASRYPTSGWWPEMYTYGDDVEAELRKFNPGTRMEEVLATFECRPTSPHLRHEFKVPKIYNAGEVLRIWAHAKLGYSFVRVNIYGVELEA
jgi:hypothetical protein